MKKSTKRAMGVIALGVLGAGAYFLVMRRASIMRQLRATGEAIGPFGQRYVMDNPEDVLQAGLLAYDLGLRPSDLVSEFSGFGSFEQRQRNRATRAVLGLGVFVVAFALATRDARK